MRLLLGLTCGTVWAASVHIEKNLGILKKSCINDACSAVRVTIDNLPVNLWGANVVKDLNTFLRGFQDDNTTKVVVFIE